MSDSTGQVVKFLVPAAQVVGLSAAGALTGFGFSFSLTTIPAILRTAPNDVLAKQWAAMYEMGKAAAPPMAIACAICFGFLATQSREQRGLLSDWQMDPTAPWALYTAAAVAVPCIVPYTLTVMLSTTVKPLLKEAAKPGTMSTETMRGLVAKWAEQNSKRQLFSLFGFLAALVATVLPGSQA